MREVSSRNFGLLIAYIVPGVVGLWGLGFVVPELRPWLLGSPVDSPTVGGFLYVTLASVALGMISSCVRWAVLDTIHHATGLQPPRWSDERLHERISGYDWIVENHYRYYQFYGNTLVSLVGAYALWRVSLPDPHLPPSALEAFLAFLAGVLFAGSRNALSRYYSRAQSLLGGTKEKRTMTNGGHHGTHPSKPGGGKPDAKKPAAGPKKPEASTKKS